MLSQSFSWSSCSFPFIRCLLTDNKIDFAELKNLLSALLRAVLKQLQVPITEDVAKKMEGGLPDLVSKALTRLDTNKDGHISYDEFKAINEVKMVSS
jgi:hypothetical protein